MEDAASLTPQREGRTVNGSFYDIDRDIHLKVVFVALCAAIAVVTVTLVLH